MSSTVTMVGTLLAGLAIFIFGMQGLGSGLQKIAGNKMRKILEVLTTIPILGVILGAVVTAIVQSSSLTTVMVVGFVNAGMMTLKQGISVIMGANIGTTITAQIIVFKITKYALPILAIGFFIYFFAKPEKIKESGHTLFAFGMLLYGLTLMSSSMAPLADSQNFKNLILLFSNYKVLGLLVGAALTGIIQSSAAVIGILIAFASSGLITLDAAVPILLGSNIGTCVTSILASIGTKITAKRAAAAHLIFNIAGSILVMILLPFFLKLVLLISPDGDLPRQIANAHTIFNIAATIVFLPIISIFSNMVIKLVPGEESVIKHGTVYLDWHTVNSPDIAITLSSKELIRMAEIARYNVANAVSAFFKKDSKLVTEVEEMEDLVDELEKDITRYLVQVAKYDMSEEISKVHTSHLHAANDIERISDHADNIADFADLTIRQNHNYSDEAINELKEMSAVVLQTLDTAIQAMKTHDLNLAMKVFDMEQQIDDMSIELMDNHIRRLNLGVCNPSAGALYSDIISNLERVGDHSNNLAHMVRGEI